MVEEKYHISVYDCFEKYGEEVFRKLEYRTLIEALNQENVVVATGGGTPCYLDAMEIINQSGCSIYVEMSPKSLATRLFHAKIIRPLTKSKTEEEIFEFVAKQLAIRKPFYKKAQYTIKGEDVDIREVVDIFFKTIRA